MNGIINYPAETERIVRTAYLAIKCAGYDRTLTHLHYRLLETAAIAGLPVSLDIAQTVIAGVMPKAPGTMTASLSPQDVGAYLRLCGNILASHRLWEDAISAYKAAYLVLASPPSDNSNSGQSGPFMAAAADDPRTPGRGGPIPIQTTMLRSLCLRLWLLCCLIQYGKLSKGKKWATSGMPLQALLAAARGSSGAGGGNAEDQGQLGLHKAYSLLLKAAESQNASEMHSVHAQHEAVFVGDGQTAGDAHLRTQQQQPAFVTGILLPSLVAQLVRCTLTRQVAGLGTLYSRISLQQAAHALATGSTNAPTLTNQQVVELLRTEIAEGRLHATIDLQGGSLVFAQGQLSDAPPDTVTDAHLDRLKRDIAETQELLVNIDKSDQLLTVQPEVLKRYVHGRRGASAGRFMGRGGSSSSGGGGMSAGGADMYSDEREAAWGMDRRRGGGAAYGGMGAVPTEEQQMAWALQASAAQR